MKSRSNSWLLGLPLSLATAIAGASGAAAGVTTLPAAQGFVHLYAGSNDNSLTPGSPPNAYSNSLSVAGAGSASGAGQFHPHPSLTAAAFATGGYNSGSIVFLQYYFEASGPTGVDVPLILTASGAVSQSTVSTGNQAILVADIYGGPQIYYIEACTNSFAVSCDGYLSSFSVEAALTVASDTTVSIALTLAVAANTGVGGRLTDSQYGYIDPIITIDPTFALANEFTLEFSPGVGNLEAGVPEPSTSAMLLGGFGGLGYLALRRRLTVTAAAETSRPRQLIPNL
jgi:hypothetical protein